TVSARATAALDSRTAFSAVLTVIKLALTVVLLGIAGWRWRRVRSELAEPVDEILAGLTLYQRGDLTAHIDVDGNSEMTAIARQAEALAAAVLAHREAIDEQRRTAQASDRLHQRALVLSRELTGLLDRDDILTVLLPAVAELAAAERVSLIAVDGDRPSHVVATTTGGDSVWDAASADVLPPHVSASGLGRAARLLQPVSYRTHEGEAALALPLGAAGRLHGVLEVVTVTPLGPGHVDALASLALAAGAAIATAAAAQRLAAESRTDAQTGLHNRRRLDEDLPRELEVCQRTSRSVGLVLLDVDHFKAYNDTYGHPGGDRLLSSLGGVLRETLRTGDSAYRYGGEEFAVLVHDTGLTEAGAAAERLRLAVAERLGVTVSLGVAVASPGSSDMTTDMTTDTTTDAGVSAAGGISAAGGWPVAVAELLAAADGALYEAKTSGRNRVCLASRGAAEVSAAEVRDAVVSARASG
ncbi:MAG: diguanylate cyclase, partial [Actinomycetes bacterium]